MLKERILNTLYSEHCAYPSTKHQISYFPLSNTVEISNYRIYFKIESHNHPTAIDPINGSATGVGGIIRDIIAEATEPYALANAILANSTATALKIAKGISLYANTIGLPTITGLTRISSLLPFPIINALALGVASSNLNFNTKLGSEIICYVGQPTDLSGIGGAVFASKELEEDKLAIQLPNPFKGRLTMEFMLEAISKGLISTAQDMGAGGLAVSLIETLLKLNLGARIDASKIPSIKKNTSSELLLISETQERFLIYTNEKSLSTLKKLASKHHTNCIPIGYTIKSRILKIFNGSSLILELDLEEVRKNYPRHHWAFTLNGIYNMAVSPKTIHTDLDLEKQVYTQFDAFIKLNSILRPGMHKLGIIRIKENNLFLSLSLDTAIEYSNTSPFISGFLSVLRGYLNTISLGFKPIAITNCINAPSPEEPENYAKILALMEGIRYATNLLRLKVQSGNVSLYNQQGSKKIPPFVVVGTLGYTEHLSLDDYKGFFDIKGKKIKTFAYDSVWDYKKLIEDIVYWREKANWGHLVIKGASSIPKPFIRLRVNGSSNAEINSLLGFWVLI